MTTLFFAALRQIAGSYANQLSLDVLEWREAAVERVIEHFAGVLCDRSNRIEFFRTTQTTSIVEGEGNLIFDRCPADILAYLMTHEESEDFDVEHWLPRVGRAMERLDLVVFVPVEYPDRVPVSSADHAEWRQRVDEELREIVLADRWEFGVEALEVTGSLQERVRRALVRVGRLPPSR